jgi:GT2 family glycosyltransferase
LVQTFLFDVKKMKKFKFFDEQFFLYWEDVDLCHRINKTKYKIIIAGS